MRLSDAIALGRTLGIKYDSSVFLCGGRGCALGMAIKAIGLDEKEWKRMHVIWPWLSDRHNDGATYRAEIGDLFRRVCSGERTLDQLIDWVRSVEPAETPTPQTEQAIATQEAQAEVCEKRS